MAAVATDTGDLAHGCAKHHGFHINLCPDCAKRTALANLRQSVWEASQFLGRDKILDYVEAVQDEIASDEL